MACSIPCCPPTKRSLQEVIGLVRGPWHTIITGSSPKVLLDILLLPRVMEILLSLFHRTSQSFQAPQIIIGGVDIKVGQPKVQDVGLGCS